MLAKPLYDLRVINPSVPAGKQHCIALSIAGTLTSRTPKCASRRANCSIRKAARRSALMRERASRPRARLRFVRLNTIRFPLNPTPLQRTAKQARYCSAA
jgi:hypothetical protein